MSRTGPECTKFWFIDEGFFQKFSLLSSGNTENSLVNRGWVNLKQKVPKKNKQRLKLPENTKRFGKSQKLAVLKRFGGKVLKWSLPMLSIHQKLWYLQQLLI